MARRKRASLKDKGPETLGLTPKKGKGIDMLFGGPLEENASAASESGPEETNDTNQTKSGGATNAAPTPSDDDLSGLVEETTVAPPVAPAIVTDVSDTLPVNEADDDESGVIISSEEVDELGLPVAMEAPPSDLEFASMPTKPGPETEEKDAFDPALSPFAAPPPAPPAPRGVALRSCECPRVPGPGRAFRTPAPPPPCAAPPRALPPRRG